MLSNHEHFATTRLAKMPKLTIANIKTRKSFRLSYTDGDGYRKSFIFNDYVSFFTMVELLNAAKRKFSYEIIDTSYVTVGK